MGLDLPPHQVAAITRRINRLARRLRGGTESRSMDQLRADVLLDLLTGTTTARGREGGGMVDIHVDLTTLAHLADLPGELAGYGPVIADIARQVAWRQAGTEWRYTVTDPVTGRPIQNGTTRRRPTASQRRHVQADRPTCIFPGCRMLAADSDLDHRIPHSEGGPTDGSNLEPLCRHDHRIRHRAGWVHEALADGDHRWTSKLGHIYITSRAPP